MPSFVSLTFLLGFSSAAVSPATGPEADRRESTSERVSHEVSRRAPARSADQAPRIAEADATGAVERHLRRGVLRGRQLAGWRSAFVDEAMQEAWCLVLEHHPGVVGMSAEDLAHTHVQVPRKNGTLHVQPLETRLAELGAIARNTVLRDNHLSRQSRHQPVRFGPLDEDAGYQLARFGTRTPPVRPS